MNTGSWMTLQPSTVNGIELGAQEWQDAVFLQYRLYTPYLSCYCDGCNVTFYICHALDYKWDGLVKVSHKDIRDGVAEPAGFFFPLSRVR